GIGNQTDGGTASALGAFGLPGMQAELALGVVPSALIPSSLFVVWGGANDYEIGGSVSQAVADIDAIVTQLELEGAQHILVPGLPDLGLTPEFQGVASASAFSQQFNSALQATLPGNAIFFDTY